MKITDIQVNVLKPPEDTHLTSLGGGSGNLLYQIHTDEGITGISEGSKGLHFSLHRAYVDDVIKPVLIGLDPCQPRRIWEILSLGDGQRASRFPSRIVGSIDVALWDIMGKAAGMPIYKLLGGAARTEIPLYWSRGNGWTKTPEEIRDIHKVKLVPEV